MSEPTPEPIELPRFQAEVTVWDEQSRPVLKVHTSGTAKAVARMVETAADTFLEEAER